MSALITVPQFPLIEEPGVFDDLTLTAATILLESEGEPWEGQLAVGYVIAHRAEAWGSSIKRVILGPEERAYDDGRPFEAFSAWNDDYTPMARARLSGAAEGPRATAWHAAAGALWGMAPDPVPAALFYLNVPLTKKIRGGSLPSWYAPLKVVKTIGRHEFLRG